MPDWIVSAVDVDDLAAGCSLLGSGGGGDPHTAVIAMRLLLEDGRSARIIEPADLSAEALVVSVGFVGAPMTVLEKLFTHTEMLTAIDAMQRRLGRPVDALIASEIGGMNGLTPLIAGALLGLPVVDADGMGRAFPLSSQVSYGIHGLCATPLVVSGEDGQLAVIETSNAAQAESMTRALCMAFGNKCFSVDYPLTKQQIEQYAVPRTVSLARAIGTALRMARARHSDPMSALRGALETAEAQAAVLVEGRVVACEHRVDGGFGVGQVTVCGADGATLDLEFQNEFLVARENGQVRASTPDIISVVASDTFENITSDSIRYGQRVTVIAIDGPRIMMTPLALSVVGPRAFKFDFDHTPFTRPDKLAARQ